MSKVAEILRTKWLPRFWDTVVLSDNPTKVVNEYCSKVESSLDDETIRTLLDGFQYESITDESLSDVRTFLSEFHNYANTFLMVLGMRDITKQPTLLADGIYGKEIRAANERLLSFHAQKYQGYLVKESTTRKKKSGLSELDFLKIEIEEFQSLFRASASFDDSYLLNRLFMEEPEVELLREMRIRFVQGDTKDGFIKVNSDRIMALGKLTAIKEYLDKLQSEVAKHQVQTPDYTHPDYKYKLSLKKIGPTGVERSNQQLEQDIKEAWVILTGGKLIDCPADTFVSIFHPDKPLKPGARWTGTNKQLRYFICQLMGITFRASVNGKKQDVETFQWNSALRDEVGKTNLPKHRVVKCFLKKGGGDLSPESFIKDQVDEPVADTKQWNEVQSGRNILNQAAQALRGF